MITALTALFTVLCLTSASNDFLSSTGTSFGVGLTTIPPRYSSVHHVVRSWLQQDYPPAVIVIFLPLKYSVFPNGVGKRKNKNFLALESELLKYFPVEMEEKRVVIQNVLKDFGPLTKYLGMLECFSGFDNHDRVIDQWVIGDDDVKYAPSTLSAYVDSLQQTATKEGVPAIMTHFDIHARLKVLLDDEFYPIAHFQGVDTVMFPRIILQQHAQESKGSFTLQHAMEVATYFHEVCPESFFQDDYVISALIFAAQIPFKSVWNGSKVALHVDDVSTSFQQMHLSVHVFDREQATKQCVEEKMSRVLRIMHDDTEMHGAQYDMLAEKLALLDGSVDVADLSSD